MYIVVYNKNYLNLLRVNHWLYFYPKHVQNKSAFLCGVMKIHRQRAKHEKDVLAPEVKRSGPAEEKIQVTVFNFIA